MLFVYLCPIFILNPPSTSNCAHADYRVISYHYLFLRLPSEDSEAACFWEAAMTETGLVQEAGEHASASSSCPCVCASRRGWLASPSAAPCCCPLVWRQITIRMNKSYLECFWKGMVWDFAYAIKYYLHHINPWQTAGLNLLAVIFWDLGKVIHCIGTW